MHVFPYFQQRIFHGFDDKNGQKYVQTNIDTENRLEFREEFARNLVFWKKFHFSRFFSPKHGFQENIEVVIHSALK